MWNNWTTWNSNPLNNNVIAGTYVVIAQDINDCVDTTEIILEEPSELSVLISSSDVNCFGDEDGTITANASGGTPIPGIPPEYNYSWSNLFNQQIDVSIANNLSSGIYTVTATDNNGCTIISESIYITEPANPLSIHVDSIDESCNLNDGAATALVLGGTLPYVYLWNTGENLSQITNLSPETYSVSVTDANGCKITSSTIVNGFTDIFLPGNLSQIDTSICLGSSLFINIQEKPTLVYEWENGSQEADRTVTPTQTGINTYTLSIYPSDPNCSMITLNAVVTVSDVPVNLSVTNNSTYQYEIHPVLSTECDTININGTDSIVCEPVHTVSISNGSIIDLFSANNNCDAYNWTWRNGNSPNQYISDNPTESGWYFINVEENECLGSDSIYVIVGVIPFDAITPNQDGWNDTWQIVGIEKYSTATVKVYNRWGALVFETSGGIGYEPWDGQNNGKDLPVGTYYYMIDLNNDEKTISGPITIIR